MCMWLCFPFVLRLRTEEHTMAQYLQAFSNHWGASPTPPMNKKLCASESHSFKTEERDAEWTEVDATMSLGLLHPKQQVCREL